MSASEALLTVTGLGLSRGGRELFAGLGFTLGAGELLLVRGPNGAGKSSLLLTLAGLLRPQSGNIAWSGGDDPAPPHLVGHLSGVKPRLTLGENLAFWQAVNGPATSSPPSALEVVGLGGLDGIEAGHLSAGQTRRLALARLLLNPRPVWLLDEPIAALDASGEGLVARLIETHLSTGGGVIAATHHDILSDRARTLALGAAR